MSGYATFVGEGAKWRFDNTMTDPRADGTLVVAFKGTRQVGEERGKSYWGGWVLSNDGGTWVCPHFTGARRADGSEHFNYCKARGTGFYKGFVYHSQWHFFEPFTAASRIAATGWISKTTQQTDK